MISLEYIVGVVLTRKDTYARWSKNTKSNLSIMTDGMVFARKRKLVHNHIKSLLVVWQSKDKKSLAMITSTVSEQVIQHILPIKSWFESLKKLKDRYDSHSKK